MSKIYVISDLHLGQATICKLRRQFSTMEEHDNYVIDSWNSVVKKRDLVYVLGDAAFCKGGLEKVARLKGMKILIMGNHDKLRTEEYLKYFQNVYGALRKHKMWFTHIPIHESELWSMANVHGHLHKKLIDNPLYYNVCCEHLDYKPKLLTEIIEDIKKANNDSI